MRKQDQLVQLISSLSAGEKRNFRRFSRMQPGDKRYMALYDALENEPGYDATRLMKKLNLSSKELRNDKYYLSQSLLRCLRNYEQPAVNIPVNRQVEITRNEITILLGRGLYTYALELAEKALALALDYEMFDMAANLMAVKYICLINTEQFDKLGDHFFDERERLAKVTAEYRALHRLGFLVAQAERTGDTTTNLDHVIKHPMMRQKPEKLQSLVAQETWFDIMIGYHTSRKNTGKVLDLAWQQWKLYDKHKTIRRIAPFIWTKSYTYLIEAESQSGSAHKALDLLRRFQAILNDSAKPVLSAGSTTWFKEHAYSMNVAILFKLRRFKELIKEAEAFDSPIIRRPVYEQFLVLLYHAIALMHEKQSSKASMKLNELLQLNSSVHKDLQLYIRPSIIICQLEMGNFEVVPYLIRSAKAWMKRHKFVSHELDVFLSLAYMLAKAPPTQKAKGWIKLREAIANNELLGLSEALHLKIWL